MQAKFAPIVPPKLLPRLKSAGHLLTYNLLLVQEVLENPDIFKAVFKDYDSFNILDNGVVETGKSFSSEQMLEAAIICNAAIVVLPDVIEDCNATLQVIKDAKLFFDQVFYGTRVRYMCVPQGRDLQEVIFCAMKIKDMTTVGMWGIPRSIVKNWGTRSDVVFHLNREFPSIPQHLLGFSDNLIDDISCARHLPVVGIDSSLPCLMGNYKEWGMEIRLEDNVNTPRPYREHDEEGKKAWDEMKWNSLIGVNINKVRHWIGEAT